MRHIIRQVFLLFSLMMLSSLLSASVPQATGSWVSANNMSSLHDGGCAVVLRDGRILVGGGSDAGGATTKVDIFAIDGSWSAASPMFSPRTDQACATLPDGHILVAGGITTGGGVTNSAEMFDPGANTWSQLAAMTEALAGASISVLQDGQVLLAGGQSTAGPSNSIEIFDPNTHTFNFGGTMSASRQDAVAVLLQDGRVLIVGGRGVDANGNQVILGSSDIYDPSTGSMSPGPALVTPRANHSATTLLDGKVAVIGGTDGSNDLATLEVYDPVAGGNFTAVSATLALPRSGHLAFLLPKNNQVLVVGGQSAGVDQASSELYIPWETQGTGADQITASMAAARSQASGSPLIANDGLLLVAGGSSQSSAELYSFATVWTDQSDYAPGTIVTITGGGWQPGETVTLTLVESPLIDSPPVMTAVADQNGNIFNNHFSPDSHDVNVRFYLTARGAQSQAQNTFTDASGDSTSTTVTCSPSSVTTGTSTTCSATVSNSAAGAPNGYPRGTVQVSFNGTGAFTPASGACTLAQVGSTNNSTCSVTLTPTAAESGLNVKGNYNSSDNGKWKNGVSPNFGLTVVAAPTGSLTSSAATITSGNSVTLTPTFSGGTGSIDQGIGVVTSGSGVSVSPAVTTTYTLTVTNALSASAKSAVTVTVVPPPAITSFTASPSTINLGNSSTLSGVFSGGTGSIDHGVGAVTSGAGVTVSPTSTMSYTLTVTNAAGTSATATATVTVNAIVPTTTTIVGGNGQTTTYGSPVADALVVQVSATGSTPTGVAALSIDGGNAVDTEALDSNGRAAFSANFASIVNAGTHALHIAYTPAAGSRFVASSSDGTVTVNQATPVITWATPADIVYGTALTATQLNATASVPGTFVYSPTPGTLLNAGSGQQLLLTFTPTDITNYTAAAKSVYINVNKANGTIGADGYTGVYDGNVHGGTGTASGVNKEDLTTLLHFSTGFSDVPGGTVTWRFDGNTNYNSATGSVQIVISQAQATVDVTGYTGVYDGNVHGASGSAEGVKGEDLSALLNLGSSFTDVPGGTATWSFAGNTNYQSASGSVAITISQADANISVSGYTGIYDGNPHGAQGTATGVKSENLSSLLALGATFIDVPGGSASWTFAGNNNYKASNGQVVITITQADAKLNVNGYTGVYDGNAHGAMSTATGVKNEDLSSLLNLGESFTHVPGGTASWIFAGNINYKSANGTVAITITPAQANINVSGYTGTYDGGAHGAAGSAVGVKAESLSSLLSLGATFTDVPGGTANWSFAGNIDYQPASGSVPIVINKADSTVNITVASVTFDGGPHSGTATASGAGGLYQSLTPNYAGTTFSGTAYALTQTPPTHAGTYQLSANFGGDTNHNPSSGAATFTISQASSSTAVTVPGTASFTYDANPHPASVSITGAGGLTLSPIPLYSCGHVPTYVADSGCLASYKFAGDNDHIGSDGGVTYSISRAPLVANANTVSMVLDGSLPQFTGSLAGVLGADGITAVYTTAATGTVIGTFPITPVLSDPNNRLPNYNLTSNNGTLTVQYAAVGLCDGDYGHQILPPIAANGTSTFKQRSTIPAKFRVCDALGNSISGPNAKGVPVVSAFNLIGIINGTVTQTVDDSVPSTTPDTSFRWDVSDQQWIFNISTSNLGVGSTYVYRISLNDGTSIRFQYGLPR